MKLIVMGVLVIQVLVIIAMDTQSFDELSRHILIKYIQLKSGMLESDGTIKISKQEDQGNVLLLTNVSENSQDSLVEFFKKKYGPKKPDVKTLCTKEITEVAHNGIHYGTAKVLKSFTAKTILKKNEFEEAEKKMMEKAKILKEDTVSSLLIKNYMRMFKEGKCSSEMGVTCEIIKYQNTVFLNTKFSQECRVDLVNKIFTLAKNNKATKLTRYKLSLYKEVEPGFSQDDSRDEFCFESQTVFEAGSFDDYCKLVDL